MGVEEKGWEGMDWIYVDQDSRQLSQLKGSWERGKEPPHSIKQEVFLDSSATIKFLKNESVAWS
jgi:hypothetical protein